MSNELKRLPTLRMKIPKSDKPHDWLRHPPDPEIVLKLHESRQKLNIYYDSFELNQHNTMNVDEELCSLTQKELDTLMKLVEKRGIDIIQTLTKSELRAIMEGTMRG